MADITVHVEWHLNDDQAVELASLISEKLGCKAAMPWQDNAWHRGNKELHGSGRLVSRGLGLAKRLTTNQYDQPGVDGDPNIMTVSGLDADRFPELVAAIRAYLFAAPWRKERLTLRQRYVNVGEEGEGRCRQYLQIEGG